MIRVVLPAHLKALARAADEERFEIEGRPTIDAVIDAVESKYPMLLGTIRDRATRKRRPYMRYFACGRDLSHVESHAPLPDAIAQGSEPFLIVGAMSGG